MCGCRCAAQCLTRELPHQGTIHRLVATQFKLHKITYLYGSYLLCAVTCTPPSHCISAILTYGELRTLPYTLLLLYTGSYLAQWSDSNTTLIVLLQQWGYNPVNTPLLLVYTFILVLYGIMHLCLTIVSILLLEHDYDD